MKPRMLVLIAALVAVAVFAVSRGVIGGSGAPAEASPSNVRLVALDHYAKWCEHCQQLDPKVATIKDDLVKSGVQFYTFDFTDDSTTKASAKRATELGVDKFVDQGSTGYITLVDSSKSKEVGRITADMSPEQMKALVAKLSKS